MPRNSAGVYSLPAGNPVASGTVISTTWANPTLSDIADELTNSLDRNGRGGMLVPFQNVDGSSAAPGVTFTNEPTSGFYRAAANDVRGVLAGQDVFRMRDDTATPAGSRNPFQIWDGSVWVNPVLPGRDITTGVLTLEDEDSTATVAQIIFSRGSIDTTNPARIYTVGDGASNVVSLRMSVRADPDDFILDSSGNVTVKGSVAATGFNGTLGATTPAAATVTTLTSNGTSVFNAPTDGIAVSLVGRSSDNLGFFQAYANDGSTSYGRLYFSASERRDQAGQAGQVFTWYNSANAEIMRLNQTLGLSLTNGAQYQIDGDGNIRASGSFLGLGASSELTISSGVVTATRGNHLIDTESDAASDDLDTINGGSEGDILVISAANDARTVVVKDATGNLALEGDFSMDNSLDRLVLIRTSAFWVELSRSNTTA